MSTYDAQTGWNELGATKSGVQISVNNGEEQFDIDQIYGNIATEPTDWDYSISTSLAEMTMARLQIAWEGAPVTTDTVGSGNEYVAAFGNPRTYTQRRLAVLHQRKNGKIRAYLFRLVQRAPQESTINHNKTGEQGTIPVRFNALPDLSIADERQRVLVIRDQV